MVLGDVRSPACKPVLSESNVTAVRFEPTPLRTGAWGQRLRPLGQTVLLPQIRKIADRLNKRPLGHGGLPNKLVPDRSNGRGGGKPTIPRVPLFCRTRGPSAKRGGSYGLAPPLAYARGGGSPGQTASVCPAFQLEAVSAHRVKLRRQASGKAEPVAVFVAPGDLPPSGGARTASPPRLHMLAGRAVRVRRQGFVSRFSWKP